MSKSGVGAVSPSGLLLMECPTLEGWFYVLLRPKIYLVTQKSLLIYKIYSVNGCQLYLTDMSI